jgi:hypothetical protein
MKAAAALKLLGLTLPKVKPDQTQAQADAALQEWKAEQLGDERAGPWKRGKATRAATKRYHPDNQETGDADAYRQIGEAVAALRRVKLRVKEAPKCAHCDTPRNDAAFCVECGEPFGKSVKRIRCSGCGDSLQNTPHLHIAYCPKCGQKTNLPDAIADVSDTERSARIARRRDIAYGRRVWQEAGYRISPSVAAMRGKSAAHAASFGVTDDMDVDSLRDVLRRHAREQNSPYGMPADIFGGRSKRRKR